MQINLHICKIFCNFAAQKECPYIYDEKNTDMDAYAAADDGKSRCAGSKSGCAG